MEKNWEKEISNIQNAKLPKSEEEECDFDKC